MAEITTSQIGNGTTAYGSDIVVKDLDLDVSNRVKDDTPVLNMCMTKKRKVNSTFPLWTDDIYRKPAAQAQVEGATVNTDQAESNGRYNLANYTQIFSTVGLTAAGETVKFWIAADDCNFISQQVASQHAEMPMVLGAAAAGTFCCHSNSSVTGMYGC